MTIAAIIYTCTTDVHELTAPGPSRASHRNSDGKKDSLWTDVSVNDIDRRRGGL